MSETFEPKPEGIGEMYDKIAALSKDMLGDSHHFGYFRGGAHDGVTMRDAADAMTDLVIERLAVTPGQRVLDLGCGTGAPAVRLAESAHVEVVGITISNEQLEIAQARAEAAGLADRVRFELVDAMKMEFDAESFDAVLAIESLEHMPDQRHVLRSITGILRPGGRFVCAQPMLHRVNDEEHLAFLRELYEMYNLPEQPFVDEYPRMFADAGLQLNRLEDVYREVMPPTLKLMTSWIGANTERLAELGDYGTEVAGLVDGMEKFADLPGAGFVVLTADKAGAR
ncbi:SAM-dependent methyltransferase [Lentzea rhizosphaerae]|uniref:SAM-dependent methyltransferase n=1 Tax=Lentzea rhizosphaerae TaxID=2041025 RepID=A0ABV8BR76_9PSEU